jgi:hypothetical protein
MEGMGQRNPAISGPRCAVDGDWIARARRITERRVGRTLGGAVGLALAVAAFAMGVASLAGHRRTVLPTTLLLLAWPAARVVDLIARAVVRAATSTAGAPPSPGYPAGGLSDRLLEARALAMRWELASVLVPLAAVSSLAPLTVHWVVFKTIFGVTATDFGLWIGVSALVAGPAHLALVLCAANWAWSLRGCETHQLTAGLRESWVRALGITCAVACVPGLVLFAAPPLITAVTGLLFVPAMYVLTARRVARERLALEAI